MTHLWDLIQAHMDDPGRQYSPIKQSNVARATGVSDQVLSKWKKGPILPDPEQLEKIARGTRLSYFDLLVAALTDKGWLVDGDGDAFRRAVDDAPAATPPPRSAVTDDVAVAPRAAGPRRPRRARTESTEH